MRVWSCAPGGNLMSLLCTISAVTVVMVRNVVLPMPIILMLSIFRKMEVAEVIEKSLKNGT